MNTDSSYLRKIALDLRDTLVEDGMDTQSANSIVRGFTQGELLLLNDIYQQDIERLAADIVQGDRLTLDGDGHVQAVVLPIDVSSSIINSLHLLKYMTVLVMERQPLGTVPSVMIERLRLLDSIPSLQRVYFYDNTFDEPPTIPQLNEYITIQYVRPLIIRSDLTLYDIYNTDLSR